MVVAVSEGRSGRSYTIHFLAVQPRFMSVTVGRSSQKSELSVSGLFYKENFLLTPSWLGVTRFSFRGCSTAMASCWSFGVGFLSTSTIMNLFCLRCKKQPRHGHGQASGVPTLPTLVVLPTPSVVPTPNVVPITRSTPDNSNTAHPVDSEVLVQGLAPITAE